MKNITIGILFLCFGCTSSTKNEHKTETQVFINQDFTQFYWLVGVWERSMRGDSSMNHFESWLLDTNGLRGMGTTIIDDIITNEEMWIYGQNDVLIYKAHPAQNATPTNFVITEIKDSFFRCENASHDFPKYIEYRCLGDSLFASIGDNLRRISFKFKKQDERNFR
ncbi:MAG: hypothetical protein ACI8SE_001629 [Bacteroidia bacterium]|jgi:hypothetical protein